MLLASRLCLLHGSLDRVDFCPYGDVMVREQVPGSSYYRSAATTCSCVRPAGRAGACSSMVLGARSSNWTDLMWMLSDRLHRYSPGICRVSDAAVRGFQAGTTPGAG